ncbi:MAG: HAMP domain-containing protein [Sulfuriflexus sp.]|nr:HAMP domain-containing protein [Sulfuriflexus sp.]
MPVVIIKRLTSGPYAAALLSILLLLSLYIMSGATEDSASFNQQYVYLLITILIGLTMLVVMIATNVIRLYRRYKLGEPGTRLTTRLLVLFVIIAVIPVCVVYYFSVDFLHRGIDSWFDVRIEQALDDSLELSRSSLDSRLRDLLRTTEQLAVDVADESEASAILRLDDLRERSGASEMTLFDGNRIVASSNSKDEIIINPNRPDEAIFNDIGFGRNYAGLDTIRGVGLQIRIVVRVPLVRADLGVRSLQALYPFTARQQELVDSVQEAFSSYNELVYLRSPLKYSFTLTLTLALLLSVLSAVWAAFYTARKLVAPITDLAEGTQAVALGDYSKRLPLPANDELGFLVESFNQMTRRIERARNDEQLSRDKVNEQQAYQACVLSNLSSGVITLDAEQCLQTFNDAASQILSIDLTQLEGKSIKELASQYARLGRFVEILLEQMQKHQQWSEEITLFGAGGRQVLVCRGVPMTGALEASGDTLIVFEDVTNLMQAQRNAAWGEVARRLAHEIKNPLTPIQLSAERLRHKYLDTMDAESAEVLDRATHTIVQQVEAMKDMVNAFSDYARAPQIKLEALNLNALIDEVLDLYRDDESDLKLNISLDPVMPHVEADAGRLRQLLHNLMKNAIEAMQDVTQQPEISIRTLCMQESNCRYVELRIEDNGPGWLGDKESELFEPYVTSKQGGTGLGLAIVKKIVEEHGGMVAAEDRPEGGARIVIRLPVLHRDGQDDAKK